MKDWLKDIVVPGISVVTALLAAWVSFSVSEVKSSIDQQKLQLDQQKASLDELTTERNLKKFDEDLTFKIYDAVSASLKAHDAQQQEAAAAIVIALASEPLRTQLLHVFDTSTATATEVKTTVARVLKAEEKFQMDEAIVSLTAVKSASGSGWGNWDVDVFYCTSSPPAAKSQAEALVAALQSNGASGRLRARELPDSVNAKAGYRIHGLIIRPDANDAPEAERATALQQLARKINLTFEVSPGRASTRWYLSAFVCP